LHKITAHYAEISDQIDILLSSKINTLWL